MSEDDRRQPEEDARERPLLRVVRGDPSDDELAALLTVVAARSASARAAATSRPRPRRSAWGDPARASRPVLHPGRDGWRRSAFPG